MAARTSGTGLAKLQAAIEDVRVVGTGPALADCRSAAGFEQGVDVVGKDEHTAT